MYYKHVQGDCLFPRTGFRQRLPITFVISFGVADPGPYLNANLEVMWASAHTVSTSSLLLALHPSFLLLWPLLLFFKDLSHVKLRLGFLNELF